MRVLLAPMGSHGDVHPMIGIGRAMQARGHDITLLAAAPFQPLAVANRFDFAEIGTHDDYQQTIDDPGLWDPDRSLQTVFNPERMRRFLPLLLNHVQQRYVPGDTVLIAGSLALNARVAHDKLGIPLATVHLQPIAMYSVVDPPLYPTLRIRPWWPHWFRRAMYWYADHYMLDPLLEPVNAYRVEIGLPRIKRLWGAWRHSPQLVLGLFPDWFANAPDWPAAFRQTGFIPYDQGENAELPAPVQAFLDAGDPPIVFSFGSAMRHGLPYFAAGAEACRILGKRGLILAKGGEQIPTNLPHGVAAFDYAPFSQVFPRSLAVVHHGGIGTTAQALKAGIPQLIMPLAFDQPDNAQRLERLGVAKSLSPKAFTPEAVAKTIADITTSVSVKRACEAIREKMQVDPIPETCRLIEALKST